LTTRTPYPRLRRFYYHNVPLLLALALVVARCLWDMPDALFVLGLTLGVLIADSEPRTYEEHLAPPRSSVHSEPSGMSYTHLHDGHSGQQRATLPTQERKHEAV
jgi:hypothetical protein